MGFLRPYLLFHLPRVIRFFVEERLNQFSRQTGRTDIFPVRQRFAKRKKRRKFPDLRENCAGLWLAFVDRETRPWWEGEDEEKGGLAR